MASRYRGTSVTARWHSEFSRLAIIVSVTGGLAISVALFFATKAWDDSLFQIAFERESRQVISTLREGIAHHLEVLRALKAFYQSSEQITRQEFRLFAADFLQRDRGIQAVEWIPKVLQSERKRFEEAARRDGLPNFRFTEKNSTGTLVEAGPREEYYPIFYVEPYSGNESTLGFDLGSTSVRRETLLRCSDSGRVTATPSVRLVQETGHQKGLLVFIPVYRRSVRTNSSEIRRESLDGFYSVVIRVEDMLNRILRDHHIVGTNVYVFEAAAHDKKDLLYFRSFGDNGARTTEVPKESELIRGFFVAEHHSVGGREWSIVLTPTPSLLATRRTWIPWMVLAAGVVITTLMTMFLIQVRKKAETGVRHLEEQTRAREHLEQEAEKRAVVERTLRESEERLKCISNSVQDAIILVDDRGEVAYWNPAAERMFGYTPSEALGKNVHELLAPQEYRTAYSAGVSDFAKTGLRAAVGRTIELQGLRRNGETFPVELSLSSFQMRGRWHAVASARDITDRKNAEEARRRSENVYRSLVEASPDPIIMYDLQGNLIAVNRQAAIAYGVESPEEFLAEIRTLADILDEESQEKAARNMRQTLATGFSWKNEYTVIRKDGSTFPVEINSTTIRTTDESPVGFISIIRDITERKKAQEMLSRLEDLYRNVVENIEDVFYRSDEQGRLLMGSPSGARLFGYDSVEEMIGLPLDSFWVNPQDCDRLIDELRKSGNVKDFEVTLRRKDGSTFLASITTHFFRDESGSIKGTQGIIRDVTARKEAERRMMLSEERFRLAWETSPDALSISRLQEGTYSDVNHGYTFLTGYAREEVIGRTALALPFWADPEDRKPFAEHLKQHGYVRNFETRMRRKDGELRSVLVSAGVMMWQGEPHILAVTKDVENLKRAQEALRTSEATLRTLLQTAPIGIGQASADGILGWTNNFLCNMLGRSREDLSGQSMRIMYESDEEFLRSGNQTHPHVIRDSTGSVETRFRRKNGTVFDVLLRLSSVVSGDLSHGLVFTAMDITERKRSEAQIRLNEARLQSLYNISQHKAESVQDLLDFTLNEAVKLTGSQVGYIYYYDEDKKLFELNTWSKEVMKECGVAEPQTLYELAKNGIWGEAVRQRKPIIVNDFRKFNPLKKGCPAGHVELHSFMTVPVFSSGRIVAVIGVANKGTDYDDSDVRALTLLMDSVWKIAEAKRSELDQRRAATALENAAEGVMITDTEGTIQYVNPSLEKMTGYSRDELLGNTPRILKSGQQDTAFYKRLWQTIKAGEIWTGRFVNKRKDGTLYTEEATISPVRDSAGTITGFVGMKRDVTEHLALSRQLFHAQKMEAIGTLAGGIAHDVNNLLQAVLGYSDLLLMKKRPGDPDTAKLKVIHQAARDGAELVSRILTFSRKGEAKTRPLDLNEEILKAEKLLRRTLPRMIEIDLVLAPDIGIVDADPAQLEQVILNLGVNAYHAMPEGGRLLLETMNVSLGDEYLKAHLGAKPGRYVLLTVSDTGVGMDSTVLERIFEPFFTTKPSGLGTGLGLSMVHGIVTQHRGFINCYSEPGRGTSFKIYLPVSDREMPFDPAETREMPALGTETVLLVDDDDRIRDMAQQMIAMGGYRVLIARSGEEALEIYSSHKEDIALVILDLIMPGMGGSRCLEELLRVDPNVKVLVASGYSPNGHAKGQESSGARGFVSKPYDAKDILGAIRRVLDKGTLE